MSILAVMLADSFYHIVELGTTEDHEGIIILPDDAPVGMPLADVMGDVVVEVDILPNMARCLALIKAFHTLTHAYDA